jgi:ABC-type antimicrobial peptide transport system permease subunit
MTGLLQIISGLVGDTLRTASFGLVAGLAAAFALMRALSSAAEGFPVFGPGPYLIATAIILVAAAAATLLPSLRTARIDPSRALRVD